MSKSSKSIVNSEDLNSVPQNSGLAVSTDQLDYAPGSTANITLTGLATGGSATFQIADLASDPGDDGDADVYKPFTATDGGRGDLDGIANGTIVTKWTVPKNGDANNATLSLTATSSDGAVATTTFTDAAGSISKVYQHWADEGVASWNNNILSANKSDYFEGEVIPHVFVYKASNKAPLVNGQAYSFTITYNYYQANTNAGGFAVITDFNESRTPGSLPGASPGQEPLIDGTFANGGGIDGSFYTVDANITNVSGVTFTGTSTKSANVTVTFIYSGPTTKSGIAEIYYGLQIATPGQVPNQGAGPTEGASAWTGGSLQTTVSVGGSGATSIQLAPSAILAGEISGVKFNDLDGDGFRDADEPGLSGWTIFLDEDDDGDLDAGEVSTTTGTDGSYTFSVTPDADKTDPDNDPYVVREVNLNGWTQTSDDPADIWISAADPTEANVNFGNQQQAPSLNIDKTADPDQTADAADELITYTLTVENTGNQTLTNVTVNDPFADANSIVRGADVVGNDDDLLEVGETWSYTAAHTVTQAEIDSNGGDDGFLENTATADSDESDEDTDDATVPVDQNPSLNIDKTADPDQTADAAGELITYTLTVENTGNQTLTNVTVTDPFADDGSIARGADVVGDDDDLLEVGETWSYTAAHTVTQGEIDSNGGDDGFLENTATADSDESDEDTDDATVPVDQNPDILLEKTGTFNDENGDGDADVGETIGYTFVVTNTGNVTLTNVTVTDPLVTVVGGPTTLDVGETDSTTFTGSYALTLADIDAGQVDNTALATGTPAVGDDTTDDDDDTVPLPDDEPVVDQLDISVDEDFLAAGNKDLPESPGDDFGTANSSGNFSINFGSDFAGATISFEALDGQAVTDTFSNPVTTSDDGSPLTYFWNAATNTLYGSTDATDATTAAATAAFTLQVTNPDSGIQTGLYSFTLHEALEHAQGVTPNTENPNIVLSLDYLVTDSDLDEVTGTLGITIDDDMPMRAADATPIAATVEEDGMSTAVADPEGLNGPDQSDGNPAAGDSTEDDQRSSLIAGSLAALVAVGADAPAAFGLDDDTSSLPDLFSKGDAVSYATSDSDLDGILDTLVATADGRTIFTLKVNTDGTWEFDLDDQLDHVDDAGNGENVDLRTALDGSTSVSAIDFSGIIAVTDADGDTANVLLAGDFTVAVEDDIPELTDADNLSIVNALGSESGAATFSVGADEPVSFIITDATGVEGVDYTISGDGKTVTGLADLDGDGNVEADEELYTFTIDDTGAYTFELLAELPPPDPVPFTAAGIASGAYDQLTLTNSGLQLVIDALAATGADTDLQVSQASGGGLAVVNNNIEDEEAVTFSFETTSGDEVPASAFTLTIKADAGNPDYVWTATLEDGTVVTLDDGGANNPGGADVTYAPLGSGDFTATVELASGELFTDLKLQVVGGQNDKAKLGLQGFSFTPDTQDVDLAFDIQATDADGDTATLQLADYDSDADLDSLLVHIEADGVTDILAGAAMQTYLQSLSTSV